MALLDASFLAAPASGVGPHSLAGVAVAANANRALYISVLLGNIAVDVTSVTRDGQSATRIFNGAAAGDVRLQWWRILNPSTGTFPVSVVTTASLNEMYIGAHSLHNVSQTAPDSAAVSSAADTPTVSLSLTATSAADLVLDVFGVSSGAPATITAGAGQTQNFASGAKYYRTFAGSTKPAGAAGSVSMVQTWSGVGTINAAFMAALVVYDAAAGATINLAGTNASQSATSSTGAVSVAPPVAGTVNLAGASCAQSATSGTGVVVISVASGTLTMVGLANNTGSAHASLTGITAYVYNAATGALVVTKTGQTTNASGNLTLNDALIVAGTTYRVIIVLAAAAGEGLAKVVAA